MKAITNHRRKLLAGLVLMLALAVLIVWCPTAAQAENAITHISIPSEVISDNGDPARVRIQYGGGQITGSPFLDGTNVSLISGTQYAWALVVNNRMGPLHSFNGGQNITITSADYCHMKIVIPSDMKNLDNSPAVVTFYDVPGPFANGEYLYFPTGIDVSWYITINGKRSDAIHKQIDCTDLNVGQMLVASYCKMKIIVPAALTAAEATVYIYGINYGPTLPYAPAQFIGGETVILPVGQTISWYLKINGKFSLPHSKLVDCTNLAVTTADYCNVLNSTGVQIDIYGYGSVAAGGSVLFPMGIQIEWKPSTQGPWPGTKKNVDCTPIVPAP